MRGFFFAVSIATGFSVGSCTVVPATPDAGAPSRTFRARANFRRMGDCLYAKVHDYWLRNHPTTIPKMDFANEVRFEDQVAVPYAVGRDWMISVTPADGAGSNIRVYEGSRGPLGGAAAFYDDALPRFVQECDAGT